MDIPKILLKCINCDFASYQRTDFLVSMGVEDKTTGEYTRKQYCQEKKCEEAFEEFQNKFFAEAEMIQMHS